MLKFMYATLVALLVSCGNPQKADPTLNGVFEGSGQGRNGQISVEVEVVEGKISSILVTAMEDTPEYAEPAIEQLTSTIIENNNINVDAFSGSSLTSKGLLDAISEALKDHLDVFTGRKIKLS